MSASPPPINPSSPTEGGFVHWHRVCFSVLPITLARQKGMAAMRDGESEIVVSDANGNRFTIVPRKRIATTHVFEYVTTEGDQVILFQGCYLVKRGDDVFETYPVDP